ncbi:MAG TPA: FAD-dependent oxidoreductase [Steroidobacteraceae bacterium]|jgi:glycine/D-amino acid oxidase-like deaminating enzyme|nr:FAD-dependent oxidoreductase [Steroidobacteraceae bacterium]
MWPFRKNSAHAVRTSEAYWLLRNGIGDAGSELTESTDCDVAIVGAGITSALVADALIATGKRIVVLDARDVALGSTSASTALLQYEIDTHLIELTRMLGAESAMRAYRACAESFARLEARFPELLPPAGYERRPSLYLAADDNAVPVLRAELAARRDIGLRCEWLDGDTLRQRFGCQRPGAIQSALGAQVDPFRLTRALFAANARHGVRIFARTRITGIEEDADRLRMLTAGGSVVTAAHAVVCGGYESLDFLPPGIADIHNTFALVTEPLPNREWLANLPLVWESNRPYLYLRSTPDGRLLVGGADLPFKNGAARDLLLPRQVRKLADQYQDLFGTDLPPVAYAWAGSFAETADGLPYIGRVPGMSSRLQFALCYGGNGITYSVHAGDMIRAGIDGRPHALDDVFGFGRLGTALHAGRQRGVAGS